MDGFGWKKRGKGSSKAGPQPVLYSKTVPFLEPPCFVITLEFLSAQGF